MKSRHEEGVLMLSIKENTKLQRQERNARDTDEEPGHSHRFEDGEAGVTFAGSDDVRKPNESKFGVDKNTPPIPVMLQVLFRTLKIASQVGKVYSLL